MSGVTADMTADVVVIGSGPGGAVTAALCAEAGKSVLLIEEGEQLALDSAVHFSRQEILQKYRNGGIGIAFGGANLTYVEGRCVGGGSEINRGLYHRLPGYVADHWRTEFAVDHLSADELTPHFEACEAIAQVQHLPGDAPLMSRRLQDGADRLGWSAIEAPRLYSYCGTNRPGFKQSMTETFIPHFVLSGGRLLADTRVQRICRTGRKWHVMARRSEVAGDGSRDVTIAADSVFVACGAVQTPALLRRSGFTHNIGNSLRFHPMLKVVALFPDAVNVPGDLDPVHQVKEFEPEIGMGCSISKPPMLALALAMHPDGMARIPRDWHRMAIYYVQSTGGGTAQVRNLPHFRDPLVTLRQAPQDLSSLYKGLTRLVEALFAAGAEAVYPSIPNFPVLRSPTDLSRSMQPRSFGSGAITSVHVFSSCPMGENERRCAADSFGRIRDAPGLYIADASLLCGPTAVNPQGTVMAIAHRNAVHAIEARFQ